MSRVNQDFALNCPIDICEDEAIRNHDGMILAGSYTQSGAVLPQTVPVDTLTDVLFDTTSTNTTYGFPLITTATGAISIPQTGLYLVVANAVLDSASLVNRVQFSITRNGGASSVNRIINGTGWMTSITPDFRTTVSRLARYIQGDTFGLQIFYSTDAGTPASLDVSAANSLTITMIKPL